MSPVTEQLRKSLYGGVSPFVSAQPKFIDGNYPHTNIRVPLISLILQEIQPSLWLELGSFVGGSALKVARAVKDSKLTTAVVCCDPFCGDVNMWDWEQSSPIKGNNGAAYRFLNLQDGMPTIYQRFIANVFFAGHFDVITPIQVTSIVGIKLFKRLFDQGRITELPTVIYLDSAHEQDETLLELQAAWGLLPKGGVLLGDDWSWPAVQFDVLRFVRQCAIDTARLDALQGQLPGSERFENILLFQGQWVLCK